MFNLFLFNIAIYFRTGRQMVFFPVTRGYIFAKQGFALLNNGDTIHVKFHYHKPPFNKKKSNEFFENGNKRTFIKYKPADFKQTSNSGYRTKNIYFFVLLNDKLVSVSDCTMQFNHNSLRKLE